MKHSELIKNLADASDLSQSQVKKVIKALSDTVKDTVKSGDDVVVHGLGKFSKKVRPAHTGVNPANGEAITVSETVSVKFKPTKELKEYLNA